MKKEMLKGAENPYAIDDEKEKEMLKG